MLAAGRPIPAAGEPIKRGEGVAIVLSGPAITAWRTAGEQWKAWISMLVSACLQTGSRKADHLHVLSCYAPTRAASRAAKDEFFRDLEHALASIPPEEPYILLGDFNAHVGSRSGAHDLWDGVRGLDGYGECNDARKECEVIHGFGRSPFTNRHGSTQNPNSGIVLTLLSCDRRTEDGAWMLL